MGALKDHIDAFERGDIDYEQLRNWILNEWVEAQDTSLPDDQLPEYDQYEDSWLELAFAGYNGPLTDEQYADITQAIIDRDDGDGLDEIQRNDPVHYAGLKAAYGHTAVWANRS